MLVRSQNKKTIIDMSNIQLYADPKNRIVSSSALEKNGSYIVLGEYSTEEKALKVLGMIGDEWVSEAKVGFNADGTGTAYMDRKVFQMPQDDEVTI